MQPSTMADQGTIGPLQPNWSYDVFLSFRGQDTRHSFTGSLYRALSRKGFNIFMDDEGLKGGDPISPSLVSAIQQSRISIVVFSKNYASSTWCLDELVEILECMRLKNKLVWPIFYKVAPSDVRHQRKSYAKAMAAHEERLGHGSDKVKKWRSALSQVADLKGWHYETGYEYEFIEKIVKRASTKLQLQQLDVGEHIVGHHSRMEEVKSLLDIDSYQRVCMLGIHAIGGMGKTTLAKALYNSIIHQFESAIFLEDVREKSNSHMGLLCLQETILSKMFEGENIKLGSVSEGVTRLKDIFQHKRVLLVLDDVDSEDQLEKLAGKCDWFGSGSRIIITTRDKDVLDIHEVEKRYEMQGLNDDEALQLFCWKAFKMSLPAMSYIEVSNRVVHYASGLPLALEVIGSHLAKKSVKGCDDALKQYENIPAKKIQDILKISYDGLEENSKHIFLDVACFFKGKSLQYVEKVFENYDFFPSENIEVLVHKSLIAIKNGCFWMHDLIQDMGREIVRLEAPLIPGERSRLYLHQDVIKVLRENSGSSKIEGIMLDPLEQEKVSWSGNAFEKMNNLRILIIRQTCFTQGPKYLPNSLKVLEWEGYPSKSLPSDFHPTDIVDLSLPWSHITLDEAKSFPNLVHLTRMDLSWCLCITHFPDVSGVPNLSELNLDFCENLISIHHSVGFHQKLEFLRAFNCIKLQDFPPRMSMPSLQSLELTDTSFALFPHVEEKMCTPLRINLFGNLIKELPDSISNLMGLEMMVIAPERDTPVGLLGLPTELFMLPNMNKLWLAGLAVGESLKSFLHSHAMSTTSQQRYSPLEELHCDYCGLTDEALDIVLCCFPNLKELHVPRNNFVSLPTSIKGSARLSLLDVSNCSKLEEIPELPTSIREVHAYGCLSLSSEAFTMLWSQALNEVYRLRVIMPGLTEIPDWFDHRWKGGTVSFWARRKLPMLVVAFILEEHAWIEDIHLHINGELCRDSYPANSNGEASIFDLRGLFSDDEKWSNLNTFLVYEWNYVEIECECFWFSYGRCNVSSSGAYVYKQETNMKDIRFTCPRLKRTLSIVDEDPPKRNHDEEAQAKQ